MWEISYFVILLISFLFQSTDLGSSKMKTTTLRTALPGNVSTVILYVAMLTLVDTVFRDIWVSYRSKTLSLYKISPKTFLPPYKRNESFVSSSWLLSLHRFCTEFAQCVCATSLHRALRSTSNHVMDKLRTPNM